MFWEQSLQFDSCTDIGLRRRNNEDAYCVQQCPSARDWEVAGHLLMVADGMGGHAVGELASRIAAETVPHTFLKTDLQDPRKRLHAAIVAANSAIHARGTQNSDFLHMGTTCTALVLCPRGAIVGHVGDSRAYRIRKDRVDQLTFDHSLEWELERQHGSLEGILDLTQHKNVITRSLGPEEVVDVDIEGPFPVQPGDQFLLCTDGVSNQLTDSELGAIVRELPPRVAARLVVHLANIRGGPDNSTVVVAQVGDLPANVPLPPPLVIPDDRPDLGWSWLIGFWALGMSIVFELAVLWTSRNDQSKQIIGGVLFAFSVAGMLALAYAAIKRRQQLRHRDDDATGAHFIRPHRTAVGLSSKQLLDLLQQVDKEVARSAREDGWSVPWEEHDRTVTAAQRAAREKRHSKGIRDLARAIELVMEQLPRRAD